MQYALVIIVRPSDFLYGQLIKKFKINSLPVVLITAIDESLVLTL
jgi:hypothetical protein